MIIMPTSCVLFCTLSSLGLLLLRYSIQTAYAWFVQEYKAADGQYRVWVLGDRVQCAVHVTSPVSPAGSTGGGVNTSMNSDGQGSDSSQGQVPAGGADFNGCVLNAQKKGSATVTAFQPNQEVLHETHAIHRITRRNPCYIIVLRVISPCTHSQLLMGFLMIPLQNLPKPCRIASKVHSR